MAKRPLTEKEKLKIIEIMHHMTPGRLGQILGRHRQSVVSFILRYKLRGSIQNKLRPGRNRILGLNDQRRIRRFLNKYRMTCLREIKQRLRLSCCLHTIRSCLRRLGLNRYKVSKKIFISDLNKERRLEFCQRHLNWDSEWRRVPSKPQWFDIYINLLNN